MADNPTSQPRDRAHSRSRVLKRAIIAYNHRCSTMPCAVRDISQSGARLLMDPGQSPPDRFELILELDGLEAGCVVRWRRQGEVGVAFETELAKRAPMRVQSVQATRPEAKPTLRKKPIVR